MNMKDMLKDIRLTVYDQTLIVEGLPPLQDDTAAVELARIIGTSGSSIISQSMVDERADGEIRLVMVCKSTPVVIMLVTLLLAYRDGVKELAE